MNLICNKNLTVQGDTGKCECRQDMRWNDQSGECQVRGVVMMMMMMMLMMKSGEGGEH